MSPQQLKLCLYFYTNNNNCIKRGAIKNYKIINNLDNVNDSIFDNIFKKLNYNGFATADFTISDNIIKIFEINPRPGGSLVLNKDVFKSFIEII